MLRDLRYLLRGRVEGPTGFLMLPPRGEPFPRDEELLKEKGFGLAPPSNWFDSILRS